jgi:hypothetical protein
VARQDPRPRVVSMPGERLARREDSAAEARSRA